jgi:hypothetical protein
MLDGIWQLGRDIQKLTLTVWSGELKSLTKEVDWEANALLAACSDHAQPQRMADVRGRR